VELRHGHPIRHSSRDQHIGLLEAVLHRGEKDQRTREFAFEPNRDAQ
jgi:hypothetical protein